MRSVLAIRLVVVSYAAWRIFGRSIRMAKANEGRIVRARFVRKSLEEVVRSLMGLFDLRRQYWIHSHSVH